MSKKEGKNPKLAVPAIKNTRKKLNLVNATEALEESPPKSIMENVMDIFTKKSDMEEGEIDENAPKQTTTSELRPELKPDLRPELEVKPELKPEYQRRPREAVDPKQQLLLISLLFLKSNLNLLSDTPLKTL